MVLMRKLILFCVAGFCVTALFSAEFDVEALSGNLPARVKDFLSDDTAKARAGMAAFSDEDLQKIVNGFKKAHDASEQRLFWLSEELYRRNAERVAAERIRYLYYAVLAALAIITVFTGLTYARARRQDLTPPPPLSTSRRGAGGEVKPNLKRKK
jgi:hypothetical protein